jgi:hypothetical protein
VCSFAINKRRFEVMTTGTRGSVFLERGVHEGKHGYRVTYEPHVAAGEGAQHLQRDSWTCVCVCVHVNTTSWHSARGFISTNVPCSPPPHWHLLPPYPCAQPLPLAGEGEAALVPLDEFYPFDGIAAAVGAFGDLVLAGRASGASAASLGDNRLSPAAALVDIELVEAVMRASPCGRHVSGGTVGVADSGVLTATS